MGDTNSEQWFTMQYITFCHPFRIPLTGSPFLQIPHSSTFRKPHMERSEMWG
ncbi:hypothetical protein Barb6XT_00361 [Bacteroidales bacterium Barb6XT]|nr:hypothetical protein Barb6XT_00361 [Bacteroidales bacterium Barb6XT]